MKRIFPLIIAASLALSLLAGCGKQPEPEPEAEAPAEEFIEEPEEEPEEEEEVVEEESVREDEVLKPLLPEVIDRYVLEQSEEVDLTANSDDPVGIIREISVADSTKVDTEKPGTYPVTYVVKVPKAEIDKIIEEEDPVKAAEEIFTEARKAFDEALKEKAEKERQAEEDGRPEEAEEEKAEEEAKAEETAEAKEDQPEEAPAEQDEERAADGDDPSEEEELIEIEIITDYIVVDVEKAVQLWNGGERVLKDRGELFRPEEPEEEPTPTPSKEEKKPEPSADSRPETPPAPQPAQPTAAPAAPAPAQPAACSHNWVAQTQTVHHDAVTHTEDQGHNEQVLIKDAWDEPTYDGFLVCNQCGFMTQNNGEMGDHSAINGHSYAFKEVQTGSIHHDAVYETRWVSNIVTVTDQPAWDEQVTTGYVCSKCGARK